MAHVTLPPETAFMIDFNLHRVPAALGLDVPPVAAAAMFDVTEADLAAYEEHVQSLVKQTALEMLEQPAISTGIDRFPIKPGGCVMAAGDSITTYRYSYAELLKVMLAISRPDDDVRFINVGQSGYTSNHALESTYLHFLAWQPDLVFIKFGVNDCKHFGGPLSKTLVSIDEYRGNMTGVVEAFQAYTPARLVLLSPTPIVESIAQANPDFETWHLSWDNADIRAFADVVREVAVKYEALYVDLVSLLGDKPDPALYVEDGLHPGPAGHRLILCKILDVLSSTRF